MKKLLLTALASLTLTAGQTITINVTQKQNKFILYSILDQKNFVECAHCGKDITEEEYCIVATVETGPYAYFLCEKCNKEFYEYLKNTQEDAKKK